MSEPEVYRFKSWAVSIIIPIFCVVDYQRIFEPDAGEKWVIVMLSLQVILAITAVVGYAVLKEKFVSKKPEGLLSLASLVLWISGLPVIMANSNKYLGVTAFFFSWIGFIFSLLICESFWHDKVTPKEFQWTNLLVSSSVVVFAFSLDPPRNYDYTQKHGKMIIAFGCVVSFASIAMLVVNRLGKATPAIEFGVSTALFLLNLVDSAVLLSIQTGSYAVWIAFFLSFSLALDCLLEFLESRQKEGAASSLSNPRPPTGVTGPGLTASASANAAANAAAVEGPAIAPTTVEVIEVSSASSVASDEDC